MGEKLYKIKKGFSALHVCGGMCNIEEENRPHLSLSYFFVDLGFFMLYKGRWGYITQNAFLA